MQVKILKECGYDESVLGFSLSYNSTIERAKEILPKYAFGIPGENKFLESIYLWIDVTAPRFWWQEADTYRLTTKQSESTMHTLKKCNLTLDNFEDSSLNHNLKMMRWGFEKYLEYINNLLEGNLMSLSDIKCLLPEGFLQRRIWVMNYKCLQNIINQRKNHKLPQWHYFIDEILKQVEHPEFLIKETGYGQS